MLELERDLGVSLRNTDKFIKTRRSGSEELLWMPIVWRPIGRRDKNIQ